MLTSSHVGKFECKVSDIAGLGAGMEKWHDLWHKGKHAGKLFLRTKWVDAHPPTGPYGGNGAAGPLGQQIQSQMK